MEDLRYCKLCLATDVKMYITNKLSILEAYSQLVNILVFEGYQLFICYECLSLLNKYQEFRSRCVTALNVLSSIDVDHSKITRDVIHNIDRKFYNLDSKLQCSSILHCNSNDQYVFENDNFNKDENLLKQNNSDLVVQQDSHKIALEYKSPVDYNVGFPNDIIFETNECILDNNYYESDRNDSDSETEKKEKENTCTSNDIVLISDDDDYVSDNNAFESETRKKQISVSKLKERKKNSIKSEIDSQDQKTNFPNEIVFVSTDSASSNKYYVPETKKKQTPAPKLKKGRENITKSNTDSQEQNTNYSDEIVVVSNNNDCVPELKNKRVTGAKLKKKLTTKSTGPIILLERLKSKLLDYVAVVPLSPDDSKKEVLSRKESTNYKDNQFKCDKCYRGFINQLTFDNHMRKHSPEFGSIICEYCNLRFTGKKYLSKHNYYSHKFKFSCMICTYVCYSLTRAVCHMNLHKGKKHKCNECGLHFRMPTSLFNHKHKCHPTECVCELCGNVYTTERGLYLHKKLSHRLENLEITGPKCEECDVQFATETAFKRHLELSSKHTVRTRKVSGSVKLPAACKLCGVWLANRSEYQSHMTSLHPRSNSLICEVCGKVFSNSREIDYHKISHSSDRPHECRECGKTFKSYMVFYQHENMHTRKRVYQCDTCQKEYTNKNALSKHIKTHFRIRPYKCTICGKSYPHPYELRTHKDYVHFKKPWPKRDRTKRQK